MRWILLLAIFQFHSLVGSAQQIIDSCFLSIEVPGRYDASETMANICRECTNNSIGSDLLEWDPINRTWVGSLPWNDTLKLEPPAQMCLSRAIWIGSKSWSQGGEGVALKLSKGLVPGQTYSFSFTYGADGTYSKDGFGPMIFTNSIAWPLDKFKVGTLPRAAYLSWRTATITFTATEEQRDHVWIIVCADEQSGTLLSWCKYKHPFENNILPADSSLCPGDQIELKLPSGAKSIDPFWSTGSTDSMITVRQAGTYSVTVRYYHCIADDTIQIHRRNCDVVLHMPNVFTPNGDDFNNVFRPIEQNFISTGDLFIYNRWGERLYNGNLFVGWNGASGNGDASSGVYYYEIVYSDERGRTYKKKGTVSLFR